MYDIVEAGYKMNMTDMQAALGLKQIAGIEYRWKMRENLWNFYHQELTGLPIELPPQTDDFMRHGYHLFNILIRPEELRITRNEIIAALHAEKIGTGFHFPALHLTTYYAKNFGYRAGDFPHAENVSERTISLPFSPYMNEQDALDVVEACRKIFQYYRK
jgi:dTDP-4-amino-4,6-dideoxygalactose transaminase